MDSNPAGREIRRCALVALVLALLAGMAGCGEGSESINNPGSGTGDPGSPVARFAYVLNASGGTITGFSTGANGALTVIAGSPFIAPPDASGMAVTGNTIWVSGDVLNPSITAFQIEADGHLRLIGSTPTSNPGGRGLHTTGTALYQFTSAGTIEGFRINSDSTLTAAPGLPLDVGPIDSIALTPNGRFLFAALETVSGPVIETFAINTDASLTPVGVPTGTGAPAPSGIGRRLEATTLFADPQNRFVFAASAVDGSLRTFAIGSDGTLAPVGAAVLVPSQPFSMASDGNTLYVGSFDSTNLYSLSIQPSGQLTLIGTFTNAMAPAYSMTLDADGLLYVANNDPGSVSVWTTTGGQLQQVPGSPFITNEMTGNNPSWIVFSR